MLAEKRKEIAGISLNLTFCQNLTFGLSQIPNYKNASKNEESFNEHSLTAWKNLKNTMNYDQNNCQQFAFITPLFSDTCKHTKNKSWRRCRLYFRCRMQSWWIFYFETDYSENYLCIYFQAVTFFVLKLSSN
jgi:hypothetical protein